MDDVMWIAIIVGLNLLGLLLIRLLGADDEGESA